ncbi:hypothetical protein [Streptomyces sp. NPDC002758]
MIPIPSLLAACQISVTGWLALAGLAFLAAFGNRISNHRNRGTK